MKGRKVYQWILSAILVGFTVLAILYYGMYDRLLKDGGDAWGYYIYLPSVFISGDLASLEYIKNKRSEFSPHTINYDINHMGFGEVYIAPNGNPVIKYTIGVAVMLSPFFLIAHGLAHLLGIPADGFQPLYWLSMYLGVLFWVVLGLFFLYKTLVRYVSTSSAYWTVVLIGLGTNLFYFTVYNSGMSHAPLFSLYGVLIYLSDTYWRKPGRISAVLIGLLCGLITMIRPVEILCIFIPLLWNLQSVSDRWNFLRSNYSWIWALPSFFIALLPQLIYWKISSGSWIFYSYGDEGFDFTSPQIRRGIMSFQNGWLIYTPIMTFALMGMYHVFKRKKSLLIPLLVILPLHLYITYSWHNWYYINSFGSRPMVEMYALLSIPFGFFLDGMQRRKAGWMVFVLGLIFVLLNQLQIWQVSRGMMLSEEGNFAYYWSLFGKIKMDERTLTASDTRSIQPRESSLTFKQNLMIYDQENHDGLEDDGTIRLPAHNSERIMLSQSCADLKSGDYLRVSVMARNEGWNSDRWNMASLTTYWEKDSGKIYNWRWLRINNKIGNPTWNLWGGEPNIWQEVKYFVKIPGRMQPSDKLHVFIQNTGHSDLSFKDFKVDLYTKK